MNGQQEKHYKVFLYDIVCWVDTEVFVQNGFNVAG